MTYKNRKVLAGIISSIFVAVVIGVTIPTITANNPTQPSEEFSQSVSTYRTSTADEFYSTGGKAWVALSIESEKEPVIKKGMSLQRTMLVNFSDGIGSYDYVTIRFLDEMPYVYPPSVGLKHSGEEIQQAAQEGQPFKRYNTANFVNIEPSEFTLNRGESKEVSLTVTIPQNIVDEFAGTFIPISPVYEVIPPEGEQRVASLIKTTPDGIHLKITSGGTS